MQLHKSMLTRILAFGLLGMAAVGTVAVADPHRSHHGENGCDFGHHYEHGMFHRLDLSEEQRDRIFELRHEQEPVMREKMKALHAARQALREAAVAQEYDAAKVQELAQKQAAALSELFVMRAQLMHQMYVHLTPAQREKFARMREWRD